MTDILECQEANYDLRLENERLNIKIEKLMNNQTELLQQNELLKNIIADLQTAIEQERVMMSRVASDIARRNSMRSSRFHSKRTGGRKKRKKTQKKH